MVDLIASTRVPSGVSVSIDHIAKPASSFDLMKLPLASVHNMSEGSKDRTYGHTVGIGVVVVDEDLGFSVVNVCLSTLMSVVKTNQ